MHGQQTTKNQVIIIQKTHTFSTITKKPFSGWCIAYIDCCIPKRARHSANTFHNLHHTAGRSQVMYLNQQCSWRSQSEKQYSQSQTKEKTLGTGKFFTKVFLFSTVLYTSIGSICPQLCSSHVLQLCQAI